MLWLVRRIRLTLADPLYRNECRQADRRLLSTSSFWQNLVGSAACYLLAAGGCVGLSVLEGSRFWLAAVVLFPSVIMPAAAGDGANAWHREARGDTLELLLLTTAERERLLWAKLLAVLRPYFWLAPLSLPLGWAAGLVLAGWSPHPKGAHVWQYGGAGLAAGAVLALLVAGGALAGAAAGMAAGIRRAGKVRRVLLAAVSAVPFVLVDLVLLAVPAAMLFGGGQVLPSWVRTLPTGEFSRAETWLVFGTLGLVVVARLALLNLHFARKTLARIAPRLDELFLDDEPPG